MKSLILKDLYNISHNAKSMIFMLLFFAFIFIPTNGPETYIITSGVLCSMMIVTTFSFDDHSKWVKYAMITPVTRKALVISKFIVLLIFSAIGAINGLIIGIIGGGIVSKVDLNNISSILPLLFTAVLSLVIGEVYGSISIPLLFKFGAEKVRILSLVALIIPAAICFGIYKLLILVGVVFTEQIIFILLFCSPVIVIAWNLLMYKISYVIFSKKELSS